MKLRNNFPDEVRNIWFETWTCQECGENGQQRGGLELHHITGRDSNSVLNGVPLCKVCHRTADGHEKEQEQRLFVKALARAISQKFEIGQSDLDFIRKHPHFQLSENGYLWDYIWQK